MEHTRRGLLFGATAATMGSVAGCLDGLGRRDDGWAVASFFTLADFTRNVVGDARSVDNAVPSGQHGHEWDPSTSILPSIVESEAFVYLDVEGFQPWVDEAIDEIESDHADDVVLIDALEGIDLLEYDGHGHEHEDGRGHTRDLEIDAIDLIDRDADAVVADAHGNHWHGGPLEIPIDGYRSLGADLEADGDITVELGGEYTLDARIADGAAAVLAVDAHGDHVHISAEEVGTTAIVVQVRYAGSVAWESPALAVDAGGGNGDHGSGDDHGHDHDHSHGEYDAKFFSDPLLAKRGVETIRDGLVEIDPDNAATYEDNAADYLERLDDLHADYERRLAERSQETVVLAGHDSFQYLAARYGFEIYTPYGLSPDDGPSQRELADVVDFVEERGIEYVLWDYFDGEDDAELIAEEAETAIDTVMVSPAESHVDAWAGEGHGEYVGQMREINLPAFEKALGAT